MTDDARRLRSALDHELSGLTVTEDARRRLRTGLAAGRAGGGAAGPAGAARAGDRATSRAPRWPVPAVIVTVVALVSTPGLVARSLRPGAPGPGTPSATIALPGGAGSAPAGSGPGPVTGSPPQQVGEPTATVTTSPVPVAPLVPSTRAGALAAGEIRLTLAEVPLRAGQPVTAEVVVPGNALPGPSDAAPTTTRSDVVHVAWGDGSTDEQRVSCGGTRDVAASLRHVYRRPGTYRVVVTTAAGACSTDGATATAVVVR